MKVSTGSTVVCAAASTATAVVGASSLDPVDLGSRQDALGRLEPFQQYRSMRGLLLGEIVEHRDRTVVVDVVQSLASERGVERRSRHTDRIGLDKARDTAAESRIDGNTLGRLAVVCSALFGVDLFAQKIVQA